MHVIHVIPIARNAPAGMLTYFAARPFPPETLVTISLRAKQVPAIVVSSEPVAHAKTAIRSSAFAMKKIPASGTPNPFLPEFLRAVRRAALSSACPEGAALFALLPTTLLASLKRTSAQKTRGEAEETPRKETKPERLLFQAERKERASAYRSLIREEFARGRSVYLAVPSIADGEAMYETLAKGIESRAFFLHGAIGKRELLLRFRSAAGAAEPVLIVGTGMFLSLPRPDLGTIILEEENGRGWKTPGRPFLDCRILAEYLAEELRARLIVAGFPLRSELIFRYRAGEFDESAPLKARAPAAANVSLVDMRGEKTHRAGEPAIVGSAMREMLLRAFSENDRAVLFAARRGLAPITICSDCATPVACPSCGLPVALFKAERGNIFLCGSCGTASPVSERCASCGGWKLTPLGIGVERAEGAVRELLPDATVVRFDRESAPSHKACLEHAKVFYETPGAILIGTEMMLPYLRRSVGYAGVVSADSLLSVPEWSAEERLFGILVKLRSLASESFIVQTRQPDRKVLSHALAGSLSDFYREELAAREAYRYPPFVTLVKITMSGKRERVAADLKRLEALLPDRELETYSPLLKTERGNFSRSALLRLPAVPAHAGRAGLPRKDWPDEKLSALLASLPVSWSVEVDPETLLS